MEIDFSSSILHFFLILDLFDNKIKGVFAILNDECTYQRPSIENFGTNLKNAYKNDTSAPISWDIHGKKSKENMFVIRHFTNEVIY